MRCRNDTPPTNPCPPRRLLAVEPGGESEPGSIETARHGKTAAIRVRGFLASTEDVFSWLDTFGGDVASLEQLAAIARSADEDPEVDLIAFDFNGHGSDVVGLAETMATLRGLKTPTAAWVQKASSGFGFLAMMADHVGLPPTGSVGSVNVLTALDTSRPDGVRYYSPSKTKQNMAAGKITDEIEQMLRDENRQALDALSRIVGEARGLSPAQVAKITTGKYFSGEAAVELGIADGVWPTAGEFTQHARTTKEDGDMPDPKTAAQVADDTTTAQDATDGVALTAAQTEGLSFLERLGGFFAGGSRTAAAPPVDTAAPDAMTAHVAALTARLEAQEAALQKANDRLAASEQRAAAADAASLRSRIAAMPGIRASDVDMHVKHVTKLQAAAPELAEEYLTDLAAAPPVIDPSIFGDVDMAAMDTGIELPPQPPGTSMDLASAVKAQAAAQVEGDIEAKLAALERADKEARHA